MLEIQIDRNSELNLSRQIYGQLSLAILRGGIGSGDRLPSSRELAQSLDVSRNTVNEAYEMLKTEGYIESRRGSACYVLDCLRLPRKNRADNDMLPKPGPAGKYNFDFRTGLPDLSEFPYYAWRQEQTRAFSALAGDDLLYGSQQGHAELRSEIAAWLFRSKGIDVDAGHVFLAIGASHAISLLVEMLNDGMGRFIVENPSHLGILKILEMKKAPYAAVPVDENGMEVRRISASDRIRSIYVTPTHQFPLGSILPAQCRVELVRLARDTGAYIIEDDYDSEFRYGGAPITPLYTLDPDRVVYVGTFSKTLFPALRIGFVLLPPELRWHWLQLRKYSDIHNPVMEQLTLAGFLRNRKMDAHVCRMRKVYAQKRSFLIRAIDREFGERARVLGDRSGLHIGLQLPGYDFDRGFQNYCLEYGMAVTPCCAYVLGGLDRYTDVLLLGYGNAKLASIEPAIRLLSALVNGFRRC